MFILRRVDAEHGEINTSLGDYYTLISKEKNGKQFNETVKEWDAEIIESVHTVIVFDCGINEFDQNIKNIMPIYKNSQYYIMTGDGKTFSTVIEK